MAHTSGALGGELAWGEVPRWAAGLVDKRPVLRWDNSQSICAVGLGPALTLGIIDSGSCKTIVDTQLCEALGIKYRKAVNGNCGTYAVPGMGQTNFYEG